MDFNAAGVPGQVPCAKTPLNDLLSSAGLTCHAVAMPSQRSHDPMVQSVREREPPLWGLQWGMQDRLEMWTGIQRAGSSEQPRAPLPGAPPGAGSVRTVRCTPSLGLECCEPKHI